MDRKKNTLWLVFVWLANIALGQTDPYAEKLLGEVSKKYDSYATLQSDFSFSARPPQGDPYSDTGVLYLHKPKNQYRINLTDRELISDGKTAWAVLKADREVQVTEADTGTEDAIGPNNLFTFYRTGFKYVAMDNERLDREVLQVIELSPEDVQKNYFKIKIRINKNKHIHDVLIFDKSGVRYTYTIRTLYVNHSLPATTFAFRESDYPGFEIVDLR